MQSACSTMGYHQIVLRKKVRDGLTNSIQTFVINLIERKKMKRITKLCFDIATTTNYYQIVFSAVLNKVGLSKTLIILIIMLL